MLETKKIEIVGLVLILMLVLTLHLITNEVVFVKGWGLVQFFGIEVSTNLVYDINLTLILVLVIIEVLLKLKEGYGYGNVSV